MDKVSAQNRRTLDLLAAKCYYYYSRSYEVTDQLDKVRRYCLLHVCWTAGAVSQNCAVVDIIKFNCLVCFCPGSVVIPVLEGIHPRSVFFKAYKPYNSRRCPLYTLQTSHGLTILVFNTDGGCMSYTYSNKSMLFLYTLGEGGRERVEC